MAKTYYHNVTKGQLNETDWCDLVTGIEDGDIILRTEAGNAWVTPLSANEIEELKEGYNRRMEDELRDNDYEDTGMFDKDY